MVCKAFHCSNKQITINWSLISHKCTTFYWWVWKLVAVVIKLWSVDLNKDPDLFIYLCVCVCASRPGPGGRHCQKTSVEHKACEGPPCPKGTPSFRDLQCLSYDRLANKKKGSMLTAIINDGETHTHTHTRTLLTALISCFFFIGCLVHRKLLNQLI